MMARKSRADLRDWRPIGPPRAGRGARAGRLVMAGVAPAAAAVALAACGSTGTGATAAPAHQAAAGGTVVSTRTLTGIGAVLVDRSGKTAYSPDQEAHGKILCTGSCLGFWFPVTVAAGTSVHGPAGLPGPVGTIHRPDNGQTQLTYNGKPLYTFRLDTGPGQSQGNNFNDQFNNVNFNWHAVTTAGATAPAPSGPAPSSPAPSSGYSYPGGSAGY